MNGDDPAICEECENGGCSHPNPDVKEICEWFECCGEPE